MAQSENAYYAGIAPMELWAAAPTEECLPEPLPLPNEDLEHFLARGYLLLPSVVDGATNAKIYQKASDICSCGPWAAAQLGDQVLGAVPELHDVLRAPALRGALEAVVGKDYVLHGHRHLHVSSGREQMWHKDSYWGHRRLRHHRPRWCMMLYYPQETTMDMGPTHVLAGSQYWTIDSETTQAGEDILRPNSGRISMFLEGRPEEREVQRREAEAFLLQDPRNAPLVEGVALTVPAGSCVLMHYDLFHRAGCRLSDSAATRYMFKMQFVRTTEPCPRGPSLAARADRAAAVAPELAPVLADVRGWLRGELAGGDAEMEEDAGEEVARAEDALRSPSSGEVERVAAAYFLGRSRGWRCLLPCLLDEREAVARAASYGLASSGPRAEAALVNECQHVVPRVRMLSAFALGESARPSAELLDAIHRALRKESCGNVCVVLLQALGCIAARARALRDEASCQRCIEMVLPYAWRLQHGFIGLHACLVILQAAGPEGHLDGHAVCVLRYVIEQGDAYMANFASEALRRHMRGAGTSSCLVPPPHPAPVLAEEEQRKASPPPLPLPAPSVAAVMPRKLATECAAVLLSAAFCVQGPLEGIVAASQ